MYPGIKNSNEWEYLSELDAFPMNCIISRVSIIAFNNRNNIYC